MCVTVSEKARERTPSAAVTELIMTIFGAHGLLLSEGDRLTRPHGLSSARWQVLGALEDRPRTVAQIGRKMGLTRQAVQRVADKLEEDGYVIYRENPEHMTAKLAALTNTGEQVLREIAERQKIWAAELSEGLKVEAIEQAASVVEALSCKLSRPKL